MSTAPTPAQSLAAAQAALDANDPRGAFGALRPLLQYPGDVADTALWAQAIGLFAPIAKALAGDELASLAAVAARQADDAQAIFNFGYQLIEVGLAGVAATALARANRLKPGNPHIVEELAVALETAMHNHAVCDLLRANNQLVESRFILAYLLAFNAVMIGDIEEARRTLPLIRRLATPQEGWGATRIEGFLARADLAKKSSPLDETDLRGWHFVLTDGVLLHLSPHGFDEGMRGRYAFVQDSPATCLEGIRRVELVLGALDRRPERVLALGDRASAILAHATASVLGLPIEPWPSELPGLIVAYDLDSIARPDLEALKAHRPGQILWGHASCWTQTQPIAGDLVTFLYQHNRDPWGRRLQVDGATGEARESEPEPGTPAEIAARMGSVTLAPDALADGPALAAFARAVAPRAAAVNTEGARERQFPGSPVQSSRFYD
ncbi:MAG TPA: hypothetical protein VN903_29390 [Polyangia bacterium]|nr:hypothetical protein [Polyangia bacterium]